MLPKQLHTTDGETINPAVVPVQNGHVPKVIQKPVWGTGFWTSTWREDTEDSDWVEWCRENNCGSPDKQSWFLLTPLDRVKLYVVDSLKDLRWLLQDYELHDPFKEYYPDLIKTIDFERMSLVYDGIWLTEKGQRETRLSLPENLTGWDCESILWFRWCFTEVQRIAVPYSMFVEE